MGKKSPARVGVIEEQLIELHEQVAEDQAEMEARALDELSSMEWGHSQHQKLLEAARVTVQRYGISPEEWYDMLQYPTDEERLVRDVLLLEKSKWDHDEDEVYWLCPRCHQIFGMYDGCDCHEHST